MMTVQAPIVANLNLHSRQVRKVSMEPDPQGRRYYLEPSCRERDPRLGSRVALERDRGYWEIILPIEEAADMG